MNHFFFAAAARTLLAIGLVLPMPGQAQTATQVRFQTTMGNFVVELYPAKAPKTVQNFVQYAQDKHFDGTVDRIHIQNISAANYNHHLVEQVF